MPYTSNADIAASDFNSLVNEPSAISSQWGVGSGKNGLGQNSAALVNTSPGDDETAVQWNGLVQAINRTLNHQGLPTVVPGTIFAGDDITVIPNLSAYSKIAYQNSGVTALARTPTTLTSIDYFQPWGARGATTDAGPRHLEFTHTVTFASADAARYFFNAGGRLDLSFVSSPTGGAATTSNSNPARQTSWTTLATSSAVSLDFSTYWSSSRTASVVKSKTFAPAPYTDNYIEVSTTLSGATANNGSQTFIIKTTWVNATGTIGVEAVVGKQTASLTVQTPSTQYLDDTWGNPTVTGAITGISSGETAFKANIIIAVNTLDFNLADAAAAVGWGRVGAVEAIVTVNPGVYVGQSCSVTGSAQSRVQQKVSVASFNAGMAFPTGSSLTIYNNGSILGAGGQGGSYATPNSGGVRGTQWAGGDALITSLPTKIYNYNTVGGGGGGGAGGDGVGHNSIGGGGGAGCNTISPVAGGLGGFGYGSVRSYGLSGSTIAGGIGTHHEEGYRSAGGGIGQPGTSSFNFNSTGQVGQPGAYAVNNHLIEWVVPGTRHGVAIN